VLEPFKLERYFARYEFNVRYMLCASDCETMSVSDLLALEPEASGRLGALPLGYTEPEGSPSLRAAISQLYRTIGKEDLLVHSGAEEAIFNFMHATLRHGDEIVVHSPCYQSLSEVAKSIGARVIPWEGRYDTEWALDASELAGLLGPKTRAVVLNTPHNPTGYLMPRREFLEVCRLVDEAGATLFSDEVYRGLEYDPEERLPAACDLSNRAVSLGVMSKTYGLPGLRIGWAATHDRQLLARMKQLKDYTTICNSAPSEFLAEVALRHHQELADRNLGIICRNLTSLDAFFDRHQDLFAWTRPKAGPIAFPRLLAGKVDDFCDELVKRSGVLLLPGTVYDDTGDHFRIGFGRENMPEALAQLEQHLGSQ
jgi:aspartate/methionine/tyrosine aminotransferase